MFDFIWPIGLVVLSNVVYHICAKSSPTGISPFASLTVTYSVGAIVSAILFFVLDRGGNLLSEYRHLNWSPFVLGIVIVGLEAGFIYAYKAGWQVSTASIVQSTFLAILLLILGFALYKERLTWNKIVGMLVCLGGLALINYQK